MRPYEHHQTSVLMPLIAAILVAFAIGSAILVEEAVVVEAVTAAVGVIIMATFTRLRTRVDAESVHAAFTFGWPRYSIRIAAIESHEVVRNRWYYGFGVRRIPGATMFNVGGLDAVAVTHRRDGKLKTFRIGTDDVDGLRAALAEATEARPPRDRPSEAPD